METEKTSVNTKPVGDSDKVLKTTTIPTADIAGSLPAVDSTILIDFEKIEHKLAFKFENQRDLPPPIGDSLIVDSVDVIKDDKSLIVNDSVAKLGQIIEDAQDTIDIIKQTTGDTETLDNVKEKIKERLLSEKPLDVVNIEDAKSKVSDLVVFGNGDAWELLCKASSKEQGWMKSTKVMEIGKKGIMMQVTTEFRVNGVVTSCAEAIQFLEGVRIQRDGNGKIEKLY